MTRRFKSWFGLDSSLCTIVWDTLVTSGWLDHAGANSKPKHCLWILHFFKAYTSEEK